ncbi:hypothetical protein OF83DRAFT_1141385 [Amylostereum chailletii]|nr:hypothetical protein OF83DRAFT_1141385 [Amylostereum chailletii]
MPPQSMPNSPPCNLQNVAPDVNFNPNFHAQPLGYIPAPGMHPTMFPAPWPPAPPPHWQNTFPVDPPFNYHVNTPASISNTYPPYVYMPNGGWDNVKLPPVHNMLQDAPLFPANNSAYPLPCSSWSPRLTTNISPPPSWTS